MARSPLTPDEAEPTLDIGGARVPVSMAAQAVVRCTTVIDLIDRLKREQGFASEADLDRLRGVLAGASEDASDA